MITQTADDPFTDGAHTLTAGTDPAAPVRIAPTDGNEADTRAHGVRICPVVLLLAATSTGIVLDRALAPLETANWVIVAMVAVTLLFVSRGHRPLATPLLLGAIAALAAGWHHRCWNDHSARDLAVSASDRPTPAWLRGTIVEMLGLRRHEGFAPDDPARISTRMIMDLEEISDGKSWSTAVGRAIVTVNGDRTDLRPGTPAEAAGQLAVIAGPLNPGEFDYRELLRARGIRLRLVVESPYGITEAPGRPLSRGRFWLAQLRESCRGRLLEPLDSRTGPLAAALILGQREEIDPEINDAFARTGTTHLLAISGLQLQALALALGLLFTLLGVPRLPSYGGVAAITVGYAILVGLVPSVVRSTVMTCTFCLAACVSRPTRPSNMLAVAGLVTLWWHPSDLFDVGCQLSFLAIAALIWLVPIARQGLTVMGTSFGHGLFGPPSPIKQLKRRFEAPWRGVLRRVVQGIGLLLLTSLVVWLAALPLVALRFHLVSPIGVLLNIPLIPLTSISLLLGAAGLALGLVWAPLGLPLFHATDLLLRAAEAIVRWGVTVRWGHWFVAGPSWIAVLAFYALLGLATVWTLAARARESTWPCPWLRGLAPWLAAAATLAPGWMISWPGNSGRRPEGDVLAVGHGLAVLVVLPDGSTLLYDCGRMGDPGVGRRILAPALWSRGLNRIDTVVLSHADQDHYNGLPDLMDRFRIGEVVIPPGFLSSQNPGAATLLETVHSRGIPVRSVAATARWSHGAATLTVLHPPAGWRPESPDNARSLVLDVAYEGRHLLLTGDLDQPGLLALNGQGRPGHIDLMLAPHHGGRSANPAALYAWAQPRSVVVSQRPPAGVAGTDALTPLERRGIPVLRTWQRGAIHFKWQPDRIIAEGFLDRGKGDARDNAQ